MMILKLWILILVPMTMVIMIMKIIPIITLKPVMFAKITNI